ncbi:unnamed protein product [Caenorhabditis auriculariae]|uniref:DNA polymerase n=1 Tax=Caenorhabditis auriculariae TaxID=2777116 RepID=A0A8S1HTV8_9PELO|nr:unnamed protein product [Caenorhabditis auriculariae]
MELVKARSYDLTELSAQLLSKQRKEVEDVASCYTSLERLFQLIDVSWLDSLLALQVIVQLNALPLFMQITNIVGGVASRTMMGGRAERNEYLLLHAFHRDTLIAPDKAQFGKKGGAGKTLNETMIEGEQEEETGGKTKGKAQYSGGLVLEPIKGLYETLILLLDFNSLYPSIIQEYNLCFTTVPHKKDGDEVPDVPDPSLKEGVLPREIRKLVECRRDVKSLMRYQKNEAEKRQLDIRQMALKLTANSMYGCLGFQYSRFYAKPIAALVTSKGREILMHSKELVEKIGYTVIYGDTDSIMINTNSLDLAQAKKLGFEIKKQVNKCHRLLELELDGVFKRLLLLKKKKYAALTLNLDTNEEKKELKGLDIVRRDWSQLAKDIGSSVVDRILDANLSRDQLVASINELLKNIRAQLDAGAVPIELFQISKQLTRNPREYADLKSQPHASTAARLNESGKFSFRHGDIIEYVICEDGSTNAATQRAYHRSEIEGSATLKIDHHYYLAQQIHPVVSRLCAPLEEIDAVRIAEALGMDSSNYRRAAAAHAVAAAENEDDAVWTPELAYDTCDPLIITCGADGCGLTAEMRKCLVLEAGDVKPRTIPTSCSSCGNGIPDGKLLNDLRLQLKAYVDRHVTSAFKCDEPMCEYKTNIVSFRWNREGMECPKCSGGILRKEYTCKQLYEQQMFFRSIVDFKKAEAALTNDQRKELQSNKNDYMSVWQTYHQMLEVVDEFLVNNSFNRVDLASIFAPMCRLK